MIRSALTAALLGCLLSNAPVVAEEVNRIDEEKAKSAAKILVAASDKMKLPIKVSVDGKSATGLHARKVALVVVPDTKLTADGLKKLDKEVMPLGLLYVTNVVTVVSADKPVAADQHNCAEVTFKNETVTINVLTLAAARVADRLVLLVYAKDKKPVIVAELNESEEKTDHALDLEARKLADKRAMLVLNVLGQYKAGIQLAASE